MDYQNKDTETLFINGLTVDIKEISSRKFSSDLREALIIRRDEPEIMENTDLMLHNYK